MKRSSTPEAPRGRRSPDRSASDVVLVGRLRDGDVAALEQVYERYASRVFALCFRMMRDHGQADEMLQDTLWQLWSRPERYDPARGSLATFLFQIARSRCLDRLRHERRRGLRNAVGDAVLELREHAAPGPTPFQSALSAEDRGRVRAALGELPPDYRDVILLAYFDGLTQAEIAAQLGAPIGTIKTRIRRGLLRLQAILSPEPPS